MLKLITIIYIIVLNIYSINAEQLAPIDVLFHGSSNADITEFEPRAEHFRDVEEGKVIFATPLISMASCFLFKWDDSWVFLFFNSQSENKSEYQVTMVISDRQRFNKSDKGGAIYLLPTHNFSYDKNKGMGIYEWTSQKSAVPIAKLSFSSALEAMQNFGVRVYFVSKKQFKKFVSLPGEKQNDYLKNLKSVSIPAKN